MGAYSFVACIGRVTIVRRGKGTRRLETSSDLSSFFFIVFSSSHRHLKSQGLSSITGQRGLRGNSQTRPLRASRRARRTGTKARAPIFFEPAVLFLLLLLLLATSGISKIKKGRVLLFFFLSRRVRIFSGGYVRWRGFSCTRRADGCKQGSKKQ